MKLSKTNLNEAQVISCFLGGLKEEIEMSVRLFNPITVQFAFASAKVQEVLWTKRVSGDSLNKYQEGIDRA